MQIPQARTIVAHTRRWSASRRYLAATGLVAIAATLRWALDPWLGEANYILFLLVVALSSLLFERGSGLWASILSAVVVAYLFAEPRNNFALTEGDTISLFVFLLSCFLVSLVAEMVRTLADKLLAADQEKETLYRELHHRTRNNLQIIGATIAVQMAKTASRETRDSLQTVADRISSIARLDQLLFRPGMPDEIEACAYLEEITDDINAALVGHRPITVYCDAEKHYIDRALAETLGITVNELVTNALKYAFPDEAAGYLAIQFRAEASALVLTVQDNGKGCPTMALGGSGWKLIQSMLGRHQGTMAVEDAAPGCKVVIRIPSKGRAAQSAA
ncbi:MAG: DUF4118 domain-containing protein [Magnetospirillum sp.]|nr:DUF4118 domain-containing protein [Magnetospirillum sp.]